MPCFPGSALAGKSKQFFSPVSLHDPAKPYGSRVCGLEISGISAGAVFATVKNNLLAHQKYDENVERVLSLPRKLSTLCKNGGVGGIRTHGTVAGTPDFEIFREFRK